VKLPLHSHSVVLLLMLSCTQCCVVLLLLLPWLHCNCFCHCCGCHVGVVVAIIQWLERYSSFQTRGGRNGVDCIVVAIIASIALPLLYCHCCCHCCSCRVGFIIVFIFVVIISCSLVSLYEKRKGSLSAGVVGEIVVVSNKGGGKGIDWHCRCIHCIHCCTDIVVAIAAAVVYFCCCCCCHHFVHGCCCTREVRGCSMVPAGVVPEEVVIPNEGGGVEGSIDWRCHHHLSSLLLRRVNYHDEFVFSTSSSVGIFLHAVVGRVCCSLAVMLCLNSFDRRIFHPSVSG
jgi:hypothetical protein